MKKIIRSLTLTVMILSLSICSFTAAAWADPDDDVDVEIPGMDQIQEIVKEENAENKPAESKASGKIDFSYSGKIDDRTGKPVTDDGYSSGNNYYILKTGELGYDAEKSRYHLLCGDKRVYCNVPSGAVLSKGYSISIEPESGLTCEMYLDGEALADKSQTTFRESGTYTLVISNEADNHERQVDFIILDDLVGKAFEAYDLPPGFEYTEVTLDGNYKTREYRDYYDFRENGHYKLVWECVQIGQSFTTQFDMDAVPPDLELPQVVEGSADKAVTFRDLEAGEYVEWSNQFEEGVITVATETLETPGNYKVTVYDKAGNFTEYQFTIEGYLDINAIMAIAVFIAVIAGIFIYSRRLRKRMRVG